MRQSLSYDEAGILYLDEWDEAEFEEELFEDLGMRSTPLGHINTPATGFKVPERLHEEHERLRIQWANETADRLYNAIEAHREST